MKKIFLTSAICMIVAMPSYADIASGAESATCDSTTIGATEDSTDLEAQWTAAQYTEPAGQYLLFANNTVSQHQTCPAGSYCPGFTNQTFADASMGLQTCPTGYASSAAGASSNEQCYRACNISNMGTGEGKTIAPIAHATAISGNDYYGAGTDTCVPTQCESGYHVGGGAGPLAGYVSTTPNNYGYKSLNGTGENRNDTGLSNGQWYATWSDGTRVSGMSTCNNTDGVYPWVYDEELGDVTDYMSVVSNIHPSSDFTAGATSGYNCYCRMDNYKLLSNGDTISVSSPSWVFLADIGDGSCAELCAESCAEYVRGTPGFRADLFGSLGTNSGTPSCVANTISIDWNPANGEAHTTNQCTYGGSVTLPATPTRPGYVFGGWKVVTTNN